MQEPDPRRRRTIPPASRETVSDGLSDEFFGGSLRLLCGIGINTRKSADVGQVEQSDYRALDLKFILDRRFERAAACAPGG